MWPKECLTWISIIYRFYSTFNSDKMCSNVFSFSRSFFFIFTSIFTRLNIRSSPSCENVCVCMCQGWLTISFILFDRNIQTKYFQTILKYCNAFMVMNKNADIDLDTTQYNGKINNFIPILTRKMNPVGPPLTYDTYRWFSCSFFRFEFWCVNRLVLLSSSS